MAVGGEEGDQDHQAAGHQSRLAGSIQPREWHLCSGSIACFHHRSDRDPNRSSDGTHVPMGPATLELRMSGLWCTLER